MSESQDWLRSFDYDDHEKAALAALEELGKLSKRARGLLLPILTEAVLMARRSEVRRVERSTPMGVVFSGETSLDQRRARLDRTFALPDGRRVSWAEATEQDHLDRIAYLEKHVYGIRQTQDEHERAIELIREHRVSCLAEIGEAA